MEIREGNVIVNVDVILDEQQKQVIQAFTKVLGKLVEEKNDVVWAVATDGLCRTKMAMLYAKDMIGDKNE